MDASERLAAPSRESADTILTHLARLQKPENGGAERIMPPEAMGDARAYPDAKAEARQGRIERTAFLAILEVMAALLALAAFRAAHSRISLDTPVMLDIAYQLDHFHRVPYRGLFDMNLPGADLVYVLLGRLCGYDRPGGISNAALHGADFALLFVLAGATWLALRRLSRLVAVAGCLLFPLVYLVGGNPVSLQREYMIAVLLAVALAVAFNAGSRRPLLSAWGVGLLLGCCAAIKPPAGLAWILFALYQAQALPSGDQAQSLPAWDGPRQRRRKLGPRAAICLASAAGFLLPLAAMAAYLASVHALGAFLDMALHYWPLYGDMTGDLRAISGAARDRYLAGQALALLWGGGLLLPALLGLWVALRAAGLTLEQRRQVWLLAGLWAFFDLYPAFSGQYWPHHLLPFQYLSGLLGALCLLPLASLKAAPKGTLRRRARAGLRLARVGALGLLLLQVGAPALDYRPELTPCFGRVDRIAAFLDANLRPGDTVQPLDWAGGAAHAMLLARAPIATPFVYDFYFYSSVSTPYIQGLRRRFLGDLAAARPRFLVEVTGWDKPWESGPDTTRQFPALRAYIGAHYHAAQTGDGYVIWERTAVAPDAGEDGLDAAGMPEQALDAAGMPEQALDAAGMPKQVLDAAGMPKQAPGTSAPGERQ